MTDKIEICKECGKRYGIKIIRYPSKLDDARNSFYCCPYCMSNKACVEIYLLGNEEVETYKID